MREYNRAAARFWTGPTGRAIRARGKDAQILALYLFTSPHMNMIGLYYLPIPTITYETGLTADEVRAAMAALDDVHFAYYDEHDELVFLPTAAVHQVGEELDPKDNRAKGVKALLYPYRHHRFARQFIERYKTAYSLRINTPPKVLLSPLQAHPKQGGGEGRRGGGGGRTDPPPQTPPPSGPEGLALSIPPADDWTLPASLESTISGAGRQHALDRIVLAERAEGREVGPQQRRKLSKRLAGGAREDDLVAELQAQAEKRQSARAQDAAYDDAIAWMTGHGGTDAVIREGQAWLDDHPAADPTDPQWVQIALRQWLNQAHAPPEVLTYILPSMGEYRRREATRR